MQISILVFLIQFSIFNCFAQQKRGFQGGLYAGAFFANNATAIMYDGYGFDFDGNRNNFDNSWLRRRINDEYSGLYGQNDQIAAVLGVNSNEWERITPEDMPQNMLYSPAFMLGLNTRYNVNEKSALIFNLNSARLSATGNYTIELTQSVNTGNPHQVGTQNIKTFQITGKEQRFILQTGLQQYLSENKIFNFFVEAGPMLNMIKFVNNRTVIEGVGTLEIDLMQSIDPFQPVLTRNLTAVDFGFFGGIGINLNTESNWMVQVVYTPSYERIGIGKNPGPFLQHAIGLRMFMVEKN